MSVEEQVTGIQPSRPATSAPRASRPTDAPAGSARQLGIRGQIPKMGLPEYWYPAIADNHVPKHKPTRRRIMGQDIVFFRNKEGEAVALTNWCPHRNASLAQGSCHFKGTITCPYHGLTFDENGKPLAFLGEGPDSTFAQQRRSSARSYPTQTHKGLVFIWMGEGDPAPIQEDVPPEFFDDRALVMHAEQRWKVNWRASLENLQDAHVFYVHRNSLEVLSQDVNGLNMLLHIGPDRPATKVVNGRALVFENPRFYDFIDSDQQRKTQAATTRPFRDTYPGLGNAKFPRTTTRLHLARAMGLLRHHLRPKMDWLVDDVEWAMGVHMPTTFRLDYQSHVYSRVVTPLDEDNSWIFYYTTTYPKSKFRRVYNRIMFHAYYNWKQHRNFSGQDKRIVEELNYENVTEKMSTSDAFPVAWREMVVAHARQPQKRRNV